ncbi:MAG: helix-turn-helix domain-containing protein [Actinomycetota bacterium]|nr:helix-turn-helix domain-containing protein [Actinomycetota bacterium]
MASAGDGSEVPNPWQAQLGALGAFIRAQRQLADLSLREMAALTRISNAYLSQVERGLHQPSLTVLRAIADALGLTTEQLLAQAGWTQVVPTDAPTDAHPDNARPPAPADPPVSTEDSIRSDPRLTEAQREALLGVYRSFVEGNAGPVET